MNVQFAIKDDVVYVIEVNLRASRTVPFVAKATGVPLAGIAAKVQAGCSLAELGFLESPKVDGFFVKEAVLPFDKLPGVDPVLGPEMRSTGEVMGHAARFGHAFAKAQMAAGMSLPTSGNALITVNDFDKAAALKIGRDLHRLGFNLYATPGTAAWFERAGLPVTVAQKAGTGGYDITAMVEAGELDLILNTPLGRQAHDDAALMRLAAIRRDVPLLTTLSAAQAAVNGIQALQAEELKVRSLQKHHGLT
jgi:carbamoyl-phosphate synthase large subunit